MNDKNQAISPYTFGYDTKKNDPNLTISREVPSHFGDHQYHTRKAEEMSNLNDRVWMT